MLVTQPDYYDNFSCIAGQCPDSCCIGWQVIPDQEHLDFYNTLQSPLGEEIRKGIVDIDGEPSFALCDGRCCMLRDDGLCKIQYALGEKALSKVCGFYPRFETELGLIREQGLSISCPEVARIILTRKEPLDIKTYETSAPLRYFHDVEPERILAVRKGRDDGLAILRNRSLCLAERMKQLLWIGLDVDETELEAPVSDCPDIKMTEEEFLSFYTELYNLFYSLDHLRPRWAELLKCCNHRNHLHRLKEEICWEQLLSYYLFKYSLRSAMDDNFLQWISVAIISVILLQDLYDKNMIELVDLVQLFAKETEHNDDNIDMIMDALWNNPVFSPESILKLLNYFR